MSNLTEVDRLIEEGLGHYGQGDINAALEAWEGALAIDPNNPQANSYVDYVRQNYELLTSELTDSAESGPFAIDDDDEPYQIEIVPGELAPPSTARLPSSDPLDAGWFIESEDGPTPGRTASRNAMVFQLNEPGTPIGFDDDTAEYPGGPPARKRPGSATEGVSFESTTSGFGSQVTDIRKRDTGFVQPTERASGELSISVRTPGAAASSGDAAAQVELSYAARASDLIDSLPTPTNTSNLPRERKLSTRELPAASRRPAPATGGIAATPPEGPSVSFRTPLPLPTQPTPNGAADPDASEPAEADLALVSAVTRDLGLRAPGTLPPPPTPPPDDEPTRARKLDDKTRADVILAFDPVTARADQILEDVDDDAPADEKPEERTRRRLTKLFERAAAWSRGGELDKAVAAIDLALSEDPNSALAQKMIHRNRDTIMSVFQQFLGDLNRQPVLARPLHELARAPIGPRAAFLLSRIDGGLSLDEILDVSGMPRLEAFRYLCQLYLRGILR